MDGDTPASLDLRRLRDALAPTVSEVRVADQLDSTNDELVRAAVAGNVADLTVQLAEFQTAGRGRAGATWTAGWGSSILCSIFVTPQRVPPDRWPALTLLAAAAVCDGLGAVGVRAAIKWPNDVVVHPAHATWQRGWGTGRKIAGVLATAVPQAPIAGVVVGLGVNVEQARADLPVAWATSARDAGATAPDRTGVTIETISAFAQRYRTWLGAAGDGRTLPVDMVETIGAEVEVALPDGVVVTGVMEGIEPDGAARFLAADGVRRALRGGNVSYLRVHGDPPAPATAR